MSDALRQAWADGALLEDSEISDVFYDDVIRRKSQTVRSIRRPVPARPDWTPPRALEASPPRSSLSTHWTADPRAVILLVFDAERGFADYRVVGAPGWRFRTAAAMEVPPPDTQVHAPIYLHEHGDKLVVSMVARDRWVDGPPTFRCPHRGCGSELRLVWR